MRWPTLRRPKPTPAPAPVPQFDALIDLDPDRLPPGATEAVASAVRRLPGAAWINVEVHRTQGGIAVRVFPAGSSHEPSDPPWPTIRAQVTETASMAFTAMSPSAPANPLASTAPRAEWLTPPPPQQLGFAEARAPNPFAALEQLEALALASRTLRPAALPDPPPAQPPAPDPLLRLLSLVIPADPKRAADAAIRRFGSYAAVLAAPEAELRAIPGLGTHSVAAIKLMHAAAIRLARARVARRPILSDRESLAAYLAAALARARIEQFRILFLDARDMLIADEVQATGTVNHTPVYPREVVRRALDLGAVALVLVHNHPSGDPAPSPEDLAMTRQVQQAARVLSLEVRDHVIVGNGRWLSFREAGLLE